MKIKLEGHVFSVKHAVHFIYTNFNQSRFCLWESIYQRYRATHGKCNGLLLRLIEKERKKERKKEGRTCFI